MQTDRFYKLRKDELDKIFSKKNICDIWRKIVRNQLRKADILDIFDYYDFNYNIEARTALLRINLLNGTYQPSLPLIYRCEKKFGVCRHLILPQPIDALVLQVITEAISKEIIEEQPSKNSYYSQDKHNVSKPHEIEEYGLNWRQLWKKMQKKIYKFHAEKELLIVTDLSNYYDSIEILELRKRITSHVKNKEVLIDILFLIIEKISWLPDYLPYIGRGLPTSNLEGIRLLAHCFLFEVDSILKDKTSDSFTRWMDDMVIGANNRNEAIEIISSVSDVLKSRGLALNLSKTDIYNSEEAEFNFLIKENKYIDSLKVNDISRDRKKILEKELYRRFNSHLKNNKAAKYSEKITKRYITIFGKLKSKKLLKQLPTLYESIPGIRQNLLIYLTVLGYSKNTAENVLEIIGKLKVYDDISLFGVCKLITSWNLKLDDYANNFIEQFISKLQVLSTLRKTPFDFYCLLWVKTKYEHPEKLYKFIIKYENIWKTEPFLRRMVTAIMARLLPFKEEKVIEFLNKQIATGEAQVVSIATHILDFLSNEKIESKVSMYLFPDSKSIEYPLCKYLVLCSVLNAPKCRDNKDFTKKIKESVKDNYYLKWIEFQYDIK